MRSHCFSNSLNQIRPGCSSSPRQTGQPRSDSPDSNSFQSRSSMALSISATVLFKAGFFLAKLLQHFLQRLVRTLALSSGRLAGNFIVNFLVVFGRRHKAASGKKLQGFACDIGRIGKCRHVRRVVGRSNRWKAVIALATSRLVNLLVMALIASAISRFSSITSFSGYNSRLANQLMSSLMGNFLARPFFDSKHIFRWRSAACFPPFATSSPAPGACRILE